MPEQTVEEILKFGIDVDPRDAMNAIKRFENEMSKRMKMVEKETKNIDRGLGKFVHQLTGAKRLWSPMLKDVAGKYKKLEGEALKYAQVLVESQRLMKSASAEQKKELQESIAKTRELIKARQESMESLERTREEIKEKITFDAKDMTDAFMEAGEELVAPLKSLLNKDVGAAFEQGGKVGGTIFTESLKAMGRFSEKAGERWGQKGADMIRKGTLRREGGGGAAGGMAMQGAGKVLQTIGGLAGKLGPMMKTLAQFGPILASASTVMGAVVKMFLDAEAAAKELNKEILATSGSSEFLQKNFGNSVLAANELNDTLKNIRTAATSLSNMDWGISKEQHTAVINSLTAEGVSLRELNKRFTELGDGTIKTEGYVKSFGQLTQMNVAYSRAFGVSLGELTQLQGEMMGEIGMNLEGVESQFEYMRKAADEAGISSNKFFGIMRGFSADLNLFTMRMEDVTHVMMALGKTMNPKNAQKFLQSISGMYKGMGLRERLKGTMLAGTGKTKDILQKDLSSRLDGLGKDLSNSLGSGVGGEIVDLIRNPKRDPKAIAKWMAKHQDKLDGKQREAILDAARMQGKLDKGGVVDIASALKDASPMAVVDHLDEVSKRMFGKPMEDLTDVQRIAFENLTGMGDEQVDQLYKMKAGIQQMQSDVVAKLQDGGTLTEEQIKMLHRLGINEKDADAATQLDAKDSRDVWNNMSMDQKDMLKSGDKAIEYQKNISDVQTSVYDRLGVLVDFMMNQFYDVVMGIWQSIPGQGEAKALAKMQTQAARSHNKDLMDAILSSQTTEEAKNKILWSNAGKTIAATLLSAPSQIDQLSDEISKLQTKHASAGLTEQPAIEKQIKELEDKKRGLVNQFGSIARGIDQQLGGTGNDKSLRKQRVSEAMQNAGVKGDSAQYAKWTEAINSGLDTQESLRQAGFSFEDVGKIMEKLRLTLSPEQLGAATAGALVSTAPTSSTASSVAPAGLPAQTGSSNASPAIAAARPATVEVKGGPSEGKQTELVDGVDGLQKTLARQGIKIDKPFLEGPYQNMMKSAVLEGAREALFEYWILQNTKDVANMIKDKGLTSGSDVLSMLGQSAFKPNAAGGSVTGIAGGMAQISRFPPAPPGEGWASVGPGEKILPAGRSSGGGGGGMKVELELKGDLKRFIEARVVEGAAEFERNKAKR